MPASLAPARDRRADGPARGQHGTRAAATLGAAVLAFFIVTLDAVVVNVALPSIGRDLGGGITGLQWIVDGYTLMFAALLLSAGSLTDRVGARRAFLGGLAAFVLASAGCGFAPGIGVLVAARLVQGAAAAVLMPSSMALIRQAYPDPARRGRAVGMWAMGGAVASCSGPVLGGVLDLIDWRWIFFINLPVGALAALLAVGARRSTRRPAPFDWTGQLTAMLAIGGLTYAAIETGTAGVTAPLVLAAAAVAVIATALFLLAQRRVAYPMMPLELFGSRAVAITMATGFAFMVGYYGLPFVFSLYFQQVRGLSAIGTGFAFLPMMLIGAALTPFSARLAERLGRRLLIVTGLASMTTGLAILGLLPGSVPIALLSAVMILVGVAGPLVSPPATALLLDTVPEHRSGVASGVFNTSRQVGGALAVAVFGGLLATPATLLRGVHVSLLIAAAVAALTAAVSMLLPTHALRASS